MKTKSILAAVMGVAVITTVLVWFRSGPTPVQAILRSPADPVGQGHVPRDRPWRVLHIMSYDSTWVEWTMGQLDAFKEPLAGLPIEYRVLEMDVKRNTAPEWKAKVTAEARALIESWKPDLVYTTDDFVQSAVVKDYLNTGLPFVFSGVNADPAAYGFTGSRNVTGVLEREHIVQSVNLLKQIVPGAKRIAVLSDRGESWPAVIERIRQAEAEMSVKIVACDVVDTYAQYQEKARGYMGEVDGLITLGVYSLKDEQGQSVPIETVMRWTYEEIPIPNISFWTNRVPQGLLCAVAISSYAQGYRAGELAREILMNGKKPSDFAIEPTVRGQPIVNLAAARKLGLKVPSTVLLTAKVVSKNDWE